MKPDISFLINNSSGTTRGQSLIQELESSQGSLAVRLIPIDWAKINKQIEQAKAAKLVVIAGGDGTLSSLIPMFIGSDTEIAILPLGTGNDLAKELKGNDNPTIFKLLDEGFEAFKNKSTRLDIWQIIETSSDEQLATFVNYFSIGFSAEVVSRFSKLRKDKYLKSKFTQRLRYILLGAKSLKVKVPNGITITAGDKESLVTSKNRNMCLIFSNISSWMGLSKVQNSNPSDGLLEATFAKSIISYARMFLAKLFPAFTLSSIGSSQSWQLDGLEKPLITNRDGEEFVINSPSIKIEHLKAIKICGVVKF